MPRKYQRLEDKINGVIPKEGMGATIHVDRYVVPCTIVSVGSTDRRTPMVGVQVDQSGEKEFIRDPEGTVMLFTYRKTDEWRQYGYGFKSGARLELAVRRSKRLTVPDADAVPLEHADAVEACGEDAVRHADAVPDAVGDAVSTAEAIRRMLAERDLK